MKAIQIFILFFSIISTSNVHANTLVITRGPVCSGMGGYLCNTIKSLDNSYKTFSQYPILEMLSYQLFNDIFPQQMAIINDAIDPENICYAIRHYRIYFKEIANDQQKQQALDAIAHIRQYLDDQKHERTFTSLLTAMKHTIMKQLYYYAACGYDVVWEAGTVISWDEETAQIRKHFDLVIDAITYCPPATMIEEWQQRNEQARSEKKYSNQRSVKWVLTSFFNCFEPVTTNQDGLIIITKKDFDELIQKAAEYIQTIPQDECGEDGIFTRREFTLEGLFTFKKKMYEKFNFENVEYVTLAPSIIHDVLLCTKQDCLNFAQALLQKSV